MDEWLCPGLLRTAAVGELDLCLLRDAAVGSAGLLLERRPEVVLTAYLSLPFSLSFSGSFDLPCATSGDLLCTKAG